MTFNIVFVSLYLVLVSLNYSEQLDFRNGMSRPWSGIRRNRISLESHVLEENKKASDAQEFLRKIEKVTGRRPDNSAITKTLNKTEQTMDYKENFVEVKIDHFAYDNKNTFNLRYLTKDIYFDKNMLHAPILFYCGNEGSIEDFWKNSGFITEVLAKEFKALVVFGEHRFFGKSFPFGTQQDYDIIKNRYLTVEQAMSDFVELVRHVRKSLDIDETHPVIAFGGSYGGMLAAWSRMKFPHVFKGAVASSAPILLFGDVDKISNNFFKIVTETYKRYDPECPASIREGFRTIENTRRSKLPYSQNLMDKINEIFKICFPIKKISELKMLEETIEDALVGLAQYNYPYETSFLNPTPGNPVKVACERIKQYKNRTIKENPPLTQSWKGIKTSTNVFLLESVLYEVNSHPPNNYNSLEPIITDSLNYLKEAVSVFFNYTGTLECLDIGNNQNETSSLNGWSYMACSEMVMPMQKDGITDMFNPQKWDLNKFTQECNSSWNADVRPEWAFNFFGGRNFEKEIENHSNILFINGQMDPWNAGCPHVNSTSSVIIIEADSAHHLDLRLPNERDPESIVHARKVTIDMLKKWNNQYYH